MERKIHKKRFAFFSGDITRSGGTERVSVQLANELAKEKEYEICFFKPGRNRQTSLFMK